MSADHARLLVAATFAVVVLIALIARARLHAFLALLLASLTLGLLGQVPFGTVVKGFQEGVGATLGFLAPVIGLGTMLGRILAETGGAEVVARRALGGMNRVLLPWAVLVVAFVIGLPVFFSVGFVLLLPVVASAARGASVPLLTLGLPLVAALSASHGLAPPHPGALAAVQILQADLGRTVLYAVVAGLPAAALAGPLVAARLARGISAVAQTVATADAAPGPRLSLGISVTVIVLPVVLMLGPTIAGPLVLPGSLAGRVVAFAGEPLVAMLLAVLIALAAASRQCGFDRARLQRLTEESLGPIASVLLIVGGGGGFSRVLDVAGVDDAIVAAAGGAALSPLVFGWAVAAALRIAVGSATVAVTTAAGLVGPMLAAAPETDRALLVVALGAGSLIASHVNDGGFWLVKELFGLSVGETVRTWTVLETVISVTGLIACLALQAFLVS